METGLYGPVMTANTSKRVVETKIYKGSEQAYNKSKHLNEIYRYDGRFFTSGAHPSEGAAGLWPRPLKPLNLPKPKFKKTQIL